MRGVRAVRLGAVCVLAIAIAGCSGQEQKGSPTAQMRTWVHGTNFAPTVSQMLHDATDASTAVANHLQTNALHTICGVLLLDVDQANSSLPTPDLSATNLLGSAYTAMGAAANHCYAAAGSAAQTAAFESSVHTARALLSEGEARISAVTGTPIITDSTTTAP